MHRDAQKVTAINRRWNTTPQMSKKIRRHITEDRKFKGSLDKSRVFRPKWDWDRESGIGYLQKNRLFSRSRGDQSTVVVLQTSRLFECPLANGVSWSNKLLWACFTFRTWSSKTEKGDKTLERARDGLPLMAKSKGADMAALWTRV